MKWIALAVFIVFLLVVAFLVLFIAKDEDLDALVRDEQEYRYFRHMNRDEDEKKG